MARATDDDGRTASETYADTRDALSGVESLADTPFAALFHAARTSGDPYTSAAVPVAVEDGEVVTGDVTMTRQGEHFHVRNTPRWDGVVSIPVRAFMGVETARNSIRTQLRDLAQKARRSERRDDR